MHSASAIRWSPPAISSENHNVLWGGCSRAASPSSPCCAEAVDEVLAAELEGRGEEEDDTDDDDDDNVDVDAAPLVVVVVVAAVPEVFPPAEVLDDAAAAAAWATC